MSYKKRILFIQYVTSYSKDPFKETKIYYQIGNELKNSSNDIEIIHLCMDKATQKFLKRKGENTITFEEIMQKYPIEKSLLQVYYKKLQYKNIDLRLFGRLGIIYAPKTSLEKILKESIKCLYASEKYLTDEEIKCIITSVAYTLYRNCLEIMARELGIITLYLSGGPMYGTMLEENFFDFRGELKHIPLKPLNEKEKEELDNFKRQFYQKKEVVWLNRTNLLKKIAEHIRSMYHYFFLFSPKLCDRSRLDFLIETITVSFPKLFKPFLAKWYYTPLENIKNKKYFFYPLQIPRDYTLPVLFPGYDNMEHVVDIFSKALPGGYLLAVKEHPHRDAISVGELRRIKSKKKVVLLPQKENPHDVIKYSSAVINISGSTGWMALMYYKPVIVFNDTPYDTANVFYSYYGLTINVDNPEKLSEAFKQALDMKIDHEKIDSFVYHVIYKKPKEFCPVPPPESPLSENITPDDISILAKFIFKKLKEKLK